MDNCSDGNFMISTGQMERLMEVEKQRVGEVNWRKEEKTRRMKAVKQELYFWPSFCWVLKNQNEVTKLTL